MDLTSLFHDFMNISETVASPPLPSCPVWKIMNLPRFHHRQFQCNYCLNEDNDLIGSLDLNVFSYTRLFVLLKFLFILEKPSFLLSVPSLFCFMFFPLFAASYRVSLVIDMGCL